MEIFIWNTVYSRGIAAGSIEFSAGLNWMQDLGHGFTLKNDGRYSVKNVTQSVPSVVTPFAIDGLLFYAIPHNLSKFGTYTFTDRVTGQTLGTVAQLPNIINGNFAGFRFIQGESNNFPGANVQKNSLFFLPLFFSKNKGQEFTDQVSVTKKLEKMSFTLGSFVSSAHVANVGLSQDFSIGVGTLEDRPHLTDLKLTGLDGKVYQVTNPNGFMDVGRDGTNLARTGIRLPSFRPRLATQFRAQLRLGRSLRKRQGERFQRAGHAEPATQRPHLRWPRRQPPDPVRQRRWYRRPPLRLQPEHQHALLFGRPQLPDYGKTGRVRAVFKRQQIARRQLFPGSEHALHPGQHAHHRPESGTARSGLQGKYTPPEAVRYAVLLCSVLSNVPNNQTFTNADGSSYNPGTQFATYKTTGLELEANYARTRRFGVRAGATFQRSTATAYKAHLENSPGPQDDALNETDNNVRGMFNLNPNYNGEKFFASFKYNSMGARQANAPNAFRLPAFGVAAR